MLITSLIIIIIIIIIIKMHTKNGGKMSMFFNVIFKIN